MKIFRAWSLVVGLVAASFCGSLLMAQEELEPEWEFEFANSEIASVHNIKWHAKDYGWLMTCQLRITSVNVIPAITHLELEGFDEAEESLWSKSQIVHEHKFDGGFFGGEAQFIRILIEDAPEGIVLMKLTYLDGREPSEGK